MSRNASQPSMVKSMSDRHTSRMATNDSVSSSATVSTLPSDGEGNAESAEEEADTKKSKADDTSPATAFQGIKISDEDENENQQENTSDEDGDENSSNASEEPEADFDIPDDDEDYEGLDLISISSGDLHVQKQESTFIEDALRGEADWVNELATHDTALSAQIDWNDGNTYQETPRSGLYDDLSAVPEVDAASPLAHVQPNSPFQDSTQILMYKDADPALQRPLFGQSEHDSVDLFDGSTSGSSSSSSSSASSPRPVAQVEDSLSQSAESISAASEDDSDTEDEDFTAEAEERARRTELRKKLERRRKQKQAPKTLKLRPKSADAEQRVDVMKNFRINPRQTAAWTQPTPRGKVLRFYEPRNMNKLRIKWVIGRTRPTPVDTTPMSAAYTLAMQSSMFRLLHCPNSPSLSFQRDRRARASHFGSNLMLQSPGLLPVPSSLGRLSIEYGEATEEDIADLFLDLDNKTDDGNDSDFMATPATASSALPGSEEDVNGLDFPTPTPMPRFQTSNDMQQTPEAPATPTTRPRKRTLDAREMDEPMSSSPSKRHQPHDITA